MPRFRDVLCGSSTGSIMVCTVYVGYVPAHWKDLGSLPTQSGPHIDGTSTA